MSMLLARPAGAQLRVERASPRLRTTPARTRQKVTHISFRPRLEHELYALDDDELLAYILAARDAQAHEYAGTATHMLLYKHEPRIRERIRWKLPEHLRHHADTVAEWVLERVTTSALRLKLEGETVGHWVSWWQTSVDRQIISFFRSKQGQALEGERDLPSEKQGADAPPDRLGTDFDEARMIERVLYGQIVASVLDELSNSTHRAIVRAAFWDDRRSKDIAAEHGETPNNIDQIKSRFRRALRAKCHDHGLTDA